MRRFTSLLVISTIALTACGGSGDTAETTPPIETEAPAENTVPAATEAPAQDTVPAETEAPAETTAPTKTSDEAADDPSGVIALSMVEWAIDTPTEIAAGTVTFDVSNGGDFPHHLAIARGNSYEELPQKPSGAVDEATLGDDFLGRTANLQSGGTATISFDLTPGNYVLFCNIAGAVSHAAQGQVLSVTVT